jgi:hypothetical protein
VNRMSEEELAAIRERLEGVSDWTFSVQPKPETYEEMWPVGQASVPYFDISLADSDGVVYLAASQVKNLQLASSGVVFLSHAPQDVRALLVEVDRLQHELRQLRSASPLSESEEA